MHLLNVSNSKWIIELLYLILLIYIYIVFFCMMTFLLYNWWQIASYTNYKYIITIYANELYTWVEINVADFKVTQNTLLVVENV